MNLDNEVCLVTGASRGIGEAIAQKLGEQGAVVVGTATSEKGAQAISGALRDKGIRGEGMMLDVTDTASIEGLLAKMTDLYGTPSVLVNNAGITQDNLLMRMKDEEWDAIINTNLSSVYRLSKACLRGMMKMRRGRIVSISSVVGSAGNAGQTNYAAAKAGLIGFSKSLAKEAGSRGITVNCVAPGFIDTDMTKSLPEAHREALLKEIPLNRLGKPDEIAAAVVYLVSPEAAYVTGVTLHVNGGMYMT